MGEARNTAESPLNVNWNFLIDLQALMLFLCLLLIEKNFNYLIAKKKVEKFFVADGIVEWILRKIQSILF